MNKIRPDGARTVETRKGGIETSTLFITKKHFQSLQQRNIIPVMQESDDFVEQPLHFLLELFNVL